MSFNPENLYHWIKERVVDNKQEDVAEIHSSFHDNPFLPPSYVQQLLALEHQDQNFYRIYTLGEWGQLDTLIFANWPEVPNHIESENWIYGTDFGFNAPSVLTKIVYDEDEQKMSVEELVYQSNLTNTQFIAECKRCIPEEEWYTIPIYCDSAEPDRIQEFINSGMRAVPTYKAAGSVRDGINLLKDWQVSILEGSVNISKERKSYSWKKDKNEHVLDEPVKWNDHAMDAIRGAVHTHYLNVMGRRGGIRVLSDGDDYDTYNDNWVNQRI
jgi:phage terminase large subunit